MKNILRKVMLLTSLGLVLVAFSTMNSVAAVVLDAAAIEADIAAAVAAGDEPAIAAKNAVASAVQAVMAANPDYPGGMEALQTDILDALAGLNITGMDTADILVAGNHAMGITIDPALEAYEAARGNQPVNPGFQGRERARARGGNAYGPGGKPANGSPT